MTGLEEVPVDRVEIGDVIVVRTGEVVPVDGTIISREAVIDTSTLSGEPLPQTASRGMPVLSGSANAGAPFDVRADRPAGESAYAALVRLVEQAQTQRAPFVRMADRYAGFFLPATILVAGLAWAVSGDPVRALAVVVVATPCPLILAAPIALVSGLLPRRASRRDRQGRRRDRDTRRSPHRAVRQDRHPDRRDTRGAGDRHPRAIRLQRAATPGGVARSPVRPRPRRSARGGGSRRRDRVDDAGQCPRGARSGDPGNRRRSSRRRRQPGVHALDRHHGRRARIQQHSPAHADRARRTSSSRSTIASRA